MKLALSLIIIAHGLIHLLGVLKAFGIAELPQLTRPIATSTGLLWLCACVLLLGFTVAWGVRLPYAWILGAAGLVVSQALAVGAWDDAKWATLGNLALLLAAALSLGQDGPWSLRSRYKDAVQAAGRFEASRQLVDADLKPLPSPVLKYLRISGAMNEPLPRSFFARMRGRIREGRDGGWMDFTSQQVNVVQPATRVFYMTAEKNGLPVEVLHTFRDGRAKMEVRLLGLIPLVRAEGEELTRAETVTVFNDLCLLAPGSLVSSQIRWEALDERHVIGHYTLGANTISALLTFNESGDLVDFESQDRLVRESDGSFEPRAWSTPVSEPRTFGKLRLWSRGEGIWNPKDAAPYAYIELELTERKP